MMRDKAERIAQLAMFFRIADIYVFGSRAKEISAEIRGGK
jgi:hypothetical protein